MTTTKNANGHTTHLLWDLEAEAPALWQHLVEREPWVTAEVERLRGHVPVPPTNNSFDDGRMFRPSGHFRAFYLRGPAKSVIALKGADVTCDDQSTFLRIMKERPFERHQRYSVVNALEYFLIQERKIPGALTQAEALAEAERAAQVQSSFLEGFGRLGKFPVPLLAIPWSEAVVARFSARLLPLLSGFSLDIAIPELQKGLACYVYWFPDQPAPRVSHYAGALAIESGHKTFAGFQQNTIFIYEALKKEKAGAVVESWLEQLAELLALGYFPSDAQHFKNGQCLEPQNVLVNGCFADLDSMVPMGDMADDRAFFTNLLVTLNLMANTMRVFLIAENNGATSLPSPFPAQFQRPDFLEMLMVIHAWERIKHHLLRLGSAHGVAVDPRLLDLVSSNMSFSVLFERVLHAIYYAGPQLPQAIRHMLGITAAYDNVSTEQEPAPAPKAAVVQANGHGA